MAGMTLIVRTVSRWVGGMVLLFGIYVVLFGHLTPGGGFAGGVIIACAFVLLTLSHGGEFALSRLKKSVASEMDSAGLLLFLLLALLGVVLAGNMFFSNFLRESCRGREFRLLSAGTIPLANIAIGLKVGMSLFMVFIILAATRVVTSAGKDGPGSEGRDEKP